MIFHLKQNNRIHVHLLFMGKGKSSGLCFASVVSFRHSMRLVGKYIHCFQRGFPAPLFPFLCTIIMLSCCVLPAHAQPHHGPVLRDVAPVPVGVAIGYFPMMQDSVYRRIVTQQFNQVTFEYALKNGAIVRPDGQLDFHQADALVQVCTDAGLKIYGHTLCWYQNNSPYMQRLAGDSAALENFLKQYIHTVMHRYPQIHAWDVVNEAIDDSTGLLRVDGPRRPGYFYWGRYLGAHYVARVFAYAHAANPSAELFYNDYDLETNSKKLAGVLRLIDTLRAHHVPITGIGTQMHISISTPDNDIDRMFRALAATGLKVRISELDIRVNPHHNPHMVLTPELERLQAQKAAHVIRSYFRYVPPAQRHDITFWNVGDRDSWIVRALHETDWPTMFDSTYHPKPMFDSVYQALQKVERAAAYP